MIASHNSRDSPDESSGNRLRPSCCVRASDAADALTTHQCSLFQTPFVQSSWTSALAVEKSVTAILWEERNSNALLPQVETGGVVPRG